MQILQVSQIIVVQKDGVHVYVYLFLSWSLFTTFFLLTATHNSILSSVEWDTIVLENGIYLWNRLVANDHIFFGVFGTFALRLLFSGQSVQVSLLGLIFFGTFWNCFSLATGSGSFLTKTNHILQIQERKIEWWTIVINWSWHSCLSARLPLYLDKLIIQLLIC